MGDQIEMVNGDHYNAKIVTVTTNEVVCASENFGTVTLPRSRVASLRFGSVAKPLPQVTVVPTPVAGAQPNSQALAAGTLSKLTVSSNAVQQVENDYLATADPAAKAKFKELLTGLGSGKINMSDIRAQAQSVASQLKQYKKDLGPEAGDALDSYLAILDNFLNESPAAGESTTSPASDENQGRVTSDAGKVR
jgi:hypothetical protein